MSHTLLSYWRLEKNTRVELSFYKEEKSKEREAKAHALSRDIETIKNEFQEVGDSDWTVSLICDYVDQLQELKKRMNQVQAMEERELALPMIMRLGIESRKPEGKTES